MPATKMSVRLTQSELTEALEEYAIRRLVRERPDLFSGVAQAVKESRVVLLGNDGGAIVGLRMKP